MDTALSPLPCSKQAFRAQTQEMKPSGIGNWLRLRERKRWPWRSSQGRCQQGNGPGVPGQALLLTHLPVLSPDHLVWSLCSAAVPLPRPCCPRKHPQPLSQHHPGPLCPRSAPHPGSVLLRGHPRPCSASSLLFSPLPPAEMGAARPERLQRPLLLVPRAGAARGHRADPGQPRPGAAGPLCCHQHRPGPGVPRVPLRSHPRLRESPAGWGRGCAGDGEDLQGTDAPPVSQSSTLSLWVISLLLEAIGVFCSTRCLRLVLELLRLGRCCRGTLRMKVIPDPWAQLQPLPSPAGLG